jgi:hypothetical protein
MRPMSTSTRIAKIRSASTSATMLSCVRKLAVAIRLMHAVKIARFLIWSGNSTIPIPNALAGVMELTDSIHLDGWTSGSRTLQRLLRPRTTSRAPIVALVTQSTIETEPPALRLSITLCPPSDERAPVS